MKSYAGVVFHKTVISIGLLSQLNVLLPSFFLAELSQTPTSELSLEGNPASPNPEVAEDLNGGDNAHQSLFSPAKSPLNEEKPIVDGDQHVPTEEPEVTELPSVTPTEPLNPLVDWGQPQAMPAPVG